MPDAFSLLATIWGRTRSRKQSPDSARYRPIHLIRPPTRQAIFWGLGNATMSQKTPVPSQSPTLLIPLAAVQMEIFATLSTPVTLTSTALSPVS